MDIESLQYVNTILIVCECPTNITRIKDTNINVILDTICCQILDAVKYFAVVLLWHRTSMAIWTRHHCCLVLQVRAPAANSRRCCYICTWSALARAHQLPFLPLPFVTSPITCLHVRFRPICTLWFSKEEKKGKGRDFASLSEALSPCNVHFTQQSKCYHLAVKMEPCIENICILTWHINSIIFQGFCRHAEDFRKWIFEKLLTANLYCLQI